MSDTLHADMTSLDDRYHEAVMSKLDSLQDDVRELRHECHTTFARATDVSFVKETVGKLDQRLDAVEKTQHELAGARKIEVGLMRWAFGILAGALAAVLAAWFLSQK